MRILVAGWEYYLIKSAFTSAQVRKQLVEEESTAASLGKISIHDVSPSTFIHTGLELEEYQYAPSFSSLVLI